MALRAIAVLFGIIQLWGSEAMFAENELLAAAVVAICTQSAKDIMNKWKANALSFVVHESAKQLIRLQRAGGVLRSQLYRRV